MTTSSPQRPRFIRRLCVTGAVVALALPVILWGAKQSSENIFNVPPTWVPEDFPQRQLYDTFLDQFEGNDVIVIAWDECTVDDPRLDKLERAILAAQQRRRATGREPVYGRVISGRSALRTLMEPPIELSRGAALSRLRGFLVGPQGHSCLIAVPTLYGAFHREETLTELLDLVEHDVGLERDDVYLVGPPVDGYRIDRESIEALRNYSIPSSLVSLLLCWYFLRSLRLTIAVIGVASIGSMFALSLVYYAGAQMNAVLIILSPLVLVVAVSGGVHLVNYYYEAARVGGPHGAAARAVAAGRGPCLMAALTTAVGLGSLSVSRMEPISVFAVVSATSVLSVVLLLLLVLPGVMELGNVPTRVMRPESGEGLPAWPRVLARLVCRRPLFWIGLSLIGMLAAGSGLRHLDVSVNVRGLFTSESRIVRDYEWFETHIGPMVPVEVVLHFGEATSADELQRLQLVAKVSLAMRELDGLDGLQSALNYLPPLPTRVIQRTLYRHRVRERLPYLEAAKCVHQGPHHQSWRISARVSALDRIDYGRYLEQLREVVEPVLAEQDAELHVRATYTGVMSLVDEAQRVLLRDLIASFCTAFIVIGGILVLTTRSLVIGSLAMFPNLLPVTIVFGVMGWRGMPVDIGTVMTASVALGFCVDGTLHFLKWFQSERDKGRDAGGAVEVAYRHCAPALVQAAMICGLGLLVFGFSEFVPVRQFAWIMLLILLLGLVADLVLLPALLAGPMVARFSRPRRATTDACRSAAEH